MSHRNTPSKIKAAAAKHNKKPGNAVAPNKKQSFYCQTAQRNNHRRDHEGDWMAGAFGPRFLCRCRA
jgi:hypothetical protein